MTDTPIERVARAICLEFYGTEYDQTSAFRQNICRALARAAIAALEEPSEGMLRRGAAMRLDTMMAPGHPDLEGNGGMYDRFQLTALVPWRAMIAAALAE